MTVLIFMALFYAPSFLSGAQDPLDGWAAPDVDLRRLDCTPMELEAARREAPGALPPPSFRGDFIERRAVICRGRLMPPGSRRAQDEAVLQRLRDTAARFAGAVKATDGAEGRTWMVQVMHPRPAVGAKISFALKNALMDVGLPVPLCDCGERATMKCRIDDRDGACRYYFTCNARSAAPCRFHRHA